MTVQNYEFEVSFLPDEHIGYANKSNNILQIAEKIGVEFATVCGGQGKCGKCKIKILEGEVSPASEEEFKLLTDSELAKGIRLACQTKVLGPVKIMLLEPDTEKKCRIVSDGYSIFDTPYKPIIKKEYFELSKVSQSDSSFLEKIEEATGKYFSKKFPFRLLNHFSLVLKENKFGITTITYENEIIGVKPGNTQEKIYGIGVDVGTTTVVVSLVNLKNGQEIGVTAGLNPQKKHGLDVLSRIRYASESNESLISLQKLIIEAINRMIKKLCTQFLINQENIYEVVVSGNPTMLHLFLGVSPYSIGRSPYKPVFRKGLTAKAHELGLDISNFGIVYCLPSVSGYIGADIVAGVIATGVYEEESPCLFIDLGTNGEIVLHHNSKTIACSCAAGPAWEGMNISCGTIASEGAIEMVKFVNGSVRFQTIENKPPVGICGTGIIDTVAELLNSGLVDNSGQFKVDGNSTLAKKVINKNEELRFILVEPTLSSNSENIFVSQKDIRQIQLAKAAISSGIKVLLNETGLDWENISKIFIAGAFGKHLRTESLERIGLIPEGSEHKVSFVGNTSKSGAILCLLSSEKRKEAEEISKNIQYLELSTYSGYEKLFIKELTFPVHR